MPLQTLCRSFSYAITLFAVISAGFAQAEEPKTAAVLKANEGFYSALNKMFAGDVGPMSEVWSHADDVMYMGPTGLYERGWAAVLKDWQGQAAMKLGGRVTPGEVHALVGQDLAVVSDFELGENTNAKGEVQRLKLRATNVYRKEKGSWKMVDHHTDSLPYLAK